jgi:hypothetical protein
VTRLRVIWNAILGRPIAYRVKVIGSIVLDEPHTLVARCDFRGV